MFKGKPPPNNMDTSTSKSKDTYKSREDEDNNTKVNNPDENNAKTREDNKVLVKQIEELVQELKALEIENEKLKDKHEQKLGLSMESIEKTKEDLYRARSTNRFLIENAETRKSQCEKLETQNFELRIQIEALKKKFGEMTKTNVELAGEVNELLKERLDFQKVVDENTRLKKIVSKYNIDVETGRIVSKVPLKRSQKIRKTQPKTENQKKELSEEKKEPVTERSDRSVRKNKNMRSAKSLEDIPSQDKINSTEKDKPTTLNYSPRGSYLGLHYTKSQKNKRS